MKPLKCFILSLAKKWVCLFLNKMDMMPKRYTEYLVGGIVLENMANIWVINSFYRLQCNYIG